MCTRIMCMARPIRLALRVILAVAVALALTGAGVVIYGLASLLASSHR
jgi:hypothetical protein